MHVYCEKPLLYYYFPHNKIPEWHFWVTGAECVISLVFTQYGSLCKCGSMYDTHRVSGIMLSGLVMIISSQQLYFNQNIENNTQTFLKVKILFHCLPSIFGSRIMNDGLPIFYLTSRLANTIEPRNWNNISMKYFDLKKESIKIRYL